MEKSQAADVMEPAGVVQAGATSDLIAELMGFASSQQVIRRYMPANKMNERELLDRMFGNRTS